MSELLPLVIGVLLLLGAVGLVRSRRDSGDPAGSVDAFSRALSAMEPGADRARAEEGADGPEAADAEGHAPTDADDNAAPRG